MNDEKKNKQKNSKKKKKKNTVTQIHIHFASHLGFEFWIFVGEILYFIHKFNRMKE